MIELLPNGIVPGVQIIGLTYRNNFPQTLTWPTGSRTFTNYDIQLSQSLNAPASLSTTIADNIAADVVQVRSGPLTFAANSFPSNFPTGSGPNPFGPMITFTTPYLYTGGDLLVTIRHTGNIIDQSFMDAQDDTQSLVGQLISGSYTATTGNFSTISIPVLQFAFVAVPEPSTNALLSLALVSIPGGLLFRRWHQRRADVIVEG